ncbi:MAG: hypothetical protein ACYCWW_02780 [Deltaproteobacteria bacterium]
MSEGRPPLVIGASLQEYFREMVEAAIQRQRLQVAEVTEFYLVNLLAEFLSTQALFPAEEGDEPLAFMLKRAQEQQGFERIRELKRLGDTSLYISGFFGDSLGGKLVDVDYYVAMGGRAYSALSEIFHGANVEPLYLELSEKFLRLVDLLGEISDRTVFQTNKGILKLYERYVKTGSERVAKLLSEQGVLPQKPRDPGFVQ